jgi:hypothetical protein
MPSESALGWTGVVGRLRQSTQSMLAFLAVGLVLACIPGGQWVFACWAGASWLFFIGGVAWHAGCAVWLVLCGLARRSAFEAWQAVLMVIAALLFVPLYFISGEAEFVGRCIALRAEALALPDDGGPRLAWRNGGDRIQGYGIHGIAYDPSGQIVRPAWLRSPQWNQRTEGSVFAGKCWGAEQIVGPFYRWDGNGCT